MIDCDRDGFIYKEDLFFLLGGILIEEYLDIVMSEVLGFIDFIIYFFVISKKLKSLDFEDIIRNVFVCYDEEVVGIIQEEYLRDLLSIINDEFIDGGVDELVVQGRLC